jgi:hypothetical protein
MLSTSAQALQIPVQRQPVQVRPVLTHLAALTNQLPLAVLVFYGRHGEPRTVLSWECRCWVVNMWEWVMPENMDY